MRLLSWNVQWCRGMDGKVDPARIAACARQVDPDVICLQEVARGFDDLEGSTGEDQVEMLRQALPRYAAFFVAAVDYPGKGGARKRFGNLLLSRLPVGRVMRHALPWCPREDVQTMPRGALEAVIESPGGALRVITAHLEFYAGSHRAAQIDRLGEIYREGDHRMAAQGEGGFAPLARPVSAVVCGDFNLPPQDPLHGRMEALGFADAWQALHPGVAHPATFHVHEEESAYCCDYVFVSEDLVPRLRAIRVDRETRASDHQPVIAELE